MVYSLHASLLALTTPARGDLFQQDVAGTESRGLLAAAENVVVQVDVAQAIGRPAGSPLLVIGAGWNVTIGTVGASYLSEASAYLSDRFKTNSGLLISPGFADAVSGTNTFDSGGVLDLTDNGIPNFELPDGILRVEFYEDYDDQPGADAVWLSGSLSVEVVVPGVIEHATLVGGVLNLQITNLAAGASNYVYRSANLSTPQWAPLLGFRTNQPEAIVTVPLTNDAPAMFYRVGSE